MSGCLIIWLIWYVFLCMFCMTIYKAVLLKILCKFGYISGPMHCIKPHIPGTSLESGQFAQCCSSSHHRFTSLPLEDMSENPNSYSYIWVSNKDASDPVHWHVQDGRKYYQLCSMMSRGAPLGQGNFLACPCLLGWVLYYISTPVVSLSHAKQI